MTLIEKLKQTVSEWMTSETAKEAEVTSVETNTVETPVEMATEAPAMEAPVDAPDAVAAMEQRIADLETLVATIVEKMDVMMKSDVAAQAMSAVEALKSELSATKEEVTKMGAQPAVVAQPAKKVEMKKQKPAVEALVARISKK